MNFFFLLILFQQTISLYGSQVKTSGLSLRSLHQQPFIFEHEQNLCKCCQKYNLNSPSDRSGVDSLKVFMVDSIKWYRKSLSPIMPPNCRFFPSCSNYGIDAIEQFGPWKGGILTAWRILRCNPIGGSGYDPPKWPPPNFFAGSSSRIKF